MTSGDTEIKNVKAHKAQSFLDRFQLDQRQLRRGDVKSGRPALLGASIRSTGQRVLVKQWRNTGEVEGQVLGEIWRQEVRQLHRLSGYPGAREFIVTLLDSGEDGTGFYLVLNPGQRLPLAAISDGLNAQHWLVANRVDRNRLTIWRNLQRIASGLDILHMQGLLHRNLDEWAVFTTADREPDFQLGGFEWSYRLAASKDSAISLDSSATVHSFVQDWKAFGELSCRLLGINAKSLLINRGRADIVDSARHLHTFERELLLLLLRADPLSRIDGEHISSRIASILGTLEHTSNRDSGALLITNSLGQGSKLSQEIRLASNKEIEVEDIDAQVEFIAEDLRQEAILGATATPNSKERQHVLIGRSLCYRIRPYQHIVRGRRSEPNWSVAHCESATVKKPAQPSYVGEQVPLLRPIEVLKIEDVRSKFASFQGRARDWSIEVARIDAELEQETPSLARYQSLVLLQALEALFVAADIWPVSLGSQSPAGERVVISLKARSDPEREKLSNLLDLQAPARRMLDVFSDDPTVSEEDWKLTDVGILGERDFESAVWRFIDVQKTANGESEFIFEGLGPLPIADSLFLRRGGYQGTDRLLRRRIQALKALREHTELLDMLEDARNSVRKTHEIPADNFSLKNLDPSKQDALREIWAVLPIFLLQGPPGVGKTRLVRELVTRRLREDPTTRILLSAQSHHAVDHVLDEVSKDFPSFPDDVIVVRSKSKDKLDGSSEFDLRRQAVRLVEKFLASELAKQAPKQVKPKLDTLKSAFGSSIESETSTQNWAIDRSVEALLLRSANLVFSSTNSGDLERLIEERAQFDWTIVEEAGKATGGELISPLLLAHRRLMIGDHQQLPPFGADNINSLLAKPDQIQSALEVGASFIGRLFREGDMEDVVEAPHAGVQLAKVCGVAAESLLLFQTMVGAELALIPKAKNTSRQPIARRLTFQHRMHPAIARLVSDTFYDGQLKTDGSCAERFESTKPPFLIDDATRLPSSPIVFVDMPFVQSEPGMEAVESLPRYHNEMEVNALMDILAVIKPMADHRPSIAILSPYREQVLRLRQRLVSDWETKLKHVKDFNFEGETGSPVNTVDSFQGSEADVVLVSLVRNNQHAGLHGLGFLSDARRMNVLLSRARWKLIVFCSLEFLGKKVGSCTGESVKKAMFIKKMLETIDELKKTKSIDGMPMASVISMQQASGGKK